MRKIILLLVAFAASLSTFAINDSGNELSMKFEGGVWQTIVDGNPGEGAFFCRLYFNENGAVRVVKQTGGRDNIIEMKRWSVENGHINIISEPGAEITDFDGASLILESDNTIAYEKDTYKSIIKPYFHGKAILHWLLILAVLIGLNELFRKSKYATIIFYVIIPLILTPLVWSQHGVTYWFKWVKIYSVVFAVIWFTLIRYTKLGKHNWVKLIAALFLAVNIAEAVSQDFSMGFLPNILNGIAGILNIITLFFGWKQIAPDTSKTKDMVWPKMTVFWIVAYDIWNIVYVYLNFPGSTSAQLMVLLSCTIPALFIKKGTWLQARGFTLAAWFMYYFTVPRFTEQMELLVPRSYNLMLAVATISILANVVYFFVWLKLVRKPKELVTT